MERGFGERIYQLRRKSSMSQESLAEKLGVSRQTISNWESERVVPDVDKLALLCKLFEISMDELVLEIVPSAVTQPEKRGNEHVVLLACIFAMATAMLLIVLSVFMLIFMGESAAEQLVQVSILVGLIAASVLLTVFFVIMLVVYKKLTK